MASWQQATAKVLDSNPDADIIGDVMLDLKRIQKLRAQLEILRRQGGLKASQLESFARRLGRRRAKRGKEPTWVSDDFPDIRPVSIPSHRGDLNRFTAGSILDQLEADLDRYEDHIRSDESRK
jgi:hypothetical protein